TDWPVKIVEITEAHIIYEHPFWDGRRILPMYEIEERGFIIANPALIDIGNEEKERKRKKRR
ncbi:hypothetical protein MCHI_003533, partial [Candidatus Magnetoovum chiemensis]